MKGAAVTLALLVLLSAEAPSAVTEGLVGWWPLDDAPGSASAVDVSGNSYHADLVNMDTAAAWVPGQDGGALSFDGFDDYLDLGTRTAFDLTSFTVTGWFRTANKSDYKVITCKETAFTDRTWWVAIESGGGELMFRTSSGGALDVSLTSGHDCADGQWHFFAAALEGTAEARLYLGRTLVASRPGPGVPDLPSAPALVGHGPGSGNRHFEGTIDEVRIYDRALDGAEIESIYVATGGDVTPPSAPTGLGAGTSGRGGVQLDWDDNTEPDLSGYRVYRSRQPGFALGASTVVADHVTDSAYVDTCYVQGVYYYKVTASDVNANESAPSAEVAVTVDEPAGCYSGIYPHLAAFNSGGECGIGAVVPWAGRLWYITYPPHAPGTSDDRLYEVDEDLALTIRPESVGGTHANRMIHVESNQLIIGPYLIDADRTVRAVPRAAMSGRLTGVARHLTDPANTVYFLGMEEEFYEVDVNTLAVTPMPAPGLPGNHGKGAYTSQGRLIFSNNGGGGVLAEWDGSGWSSVETEKFTEVTGPGGIYGAPDGAAPAWALGWDGRSAILMLLEGGTWHRFRLPKASHTYDAAHGWYTEWPRIRAVPQDTMLMDVHGMLYDFPEGFADGATGGIRPIATHLKMIVDFADWNGRLVVAADDASKLDNPSVGTSQSNLWFGTLEDLQRFGDPYGFGGPWVRDAVGAAVPSDPFLVAGFAHRTAHFAHDAAGAVTFTMEVDASGDGTWTAYDTVTVPAGGYAYRVLPDDLDAEWMRFSTDVPVGAATVCLRCSSGPDAPDGSTFTSLATPDAPLPRSSGIVRARDGTLQYLASYVDEAGQLTGTGYYEIGADMLLRAVDDAAAAQDMADNYAVAGKDFDLDAASVIVTGGGGDRFRLPRGPAVYDAAWAEGWPRGVREVVTERSLMNVHGTFYELPRDDSGGMRRIKPVATHHRMIHDFCSWRGMLVLTGNLDGATDESHFVESDDGRAGLRFGNVDDLWRLGPPRGIGGPWLDTAASAGAASDPYLMAGYRSKRLTLAHDAGASVYVTVEVDFLADDTWHEYATLEVQAAQTLRHTFPDGFDAHWVRLTSDTACTISGQFVYDCFHLDPASANGDGMPLTPTFAWLSSIDATGYRLVVALDPDLTSVVLDTAVTGTSHTPALPSPFLAGTTYYWTVIAVDAGGNELEAANAPLSFTTSPAAAPDDHGGGCAPGAVGTLSGFLLAAIVAWATCRRS